MSEKYLKVGQRVELTGKDTKGTIAYVGKFYLNLLIGFIMFDIFFFFKF